MNRTATFTIGKLSRNGDTSAPRNCEARLTITLRDTPHGPEFSATGEVWNHLQTDITMGGQCVAEIAEHFPRHPIAQAIKRLHAAHHLNGMQAGTPAQNEALRECTSHAYTERCEFLAARGLNPDPNGPDGKPYRYGSAWLYAPIPADDLAAINDLLGIKQSPPEEGDDLLAGITMSTCYDAEAAMRDKQRPRLAWRCTIKTDPAAAGITVPYFKGEAHAPAYKRQAPRHLKRDAEAVAAECRTGMIHHIAEYGSPRPTGKPVPPPTLREVMGALLREASVIDFADYPAWATDYGYDPDSITARNTYATCLQNTLGLRGMLGAERFEALREANA